MYSEKDICEPAEPIVHFGIHLRKRKYNKLARDNYALIDKKSSLGLVRDAKARNKDLKKSGQPEKYDIRANKWGLIYTDEWCKQHKENALENYDLNMSYYKSIREDFDKIFENYLENEGRLFKQYINLKDKDMKKPGVYMLVLDEYKRIYVGITREQTIKKRILQHWSRKKEFDRLIWGSINTSLISIDSFGCLDTTRIYAIPFDESEVHKLEEIEYNILNNHKLREYYQNRTSGGLRSYAEAVFYARGMKNN